MKKILKILLGVVGIIYCTFFLMKNWKEHEIIKTFEEKYSNEKFYFIQGLDYKFDLNTSVRYRGILYSDKLKEKKYPYGIEISIESGSNGENNVEKYKELLFKIENEKEIENKMKEIFGEKTVFYQDNYVAVNLFVDKLENINQDELRKKTYEFGKYLLEEKGITKSLQVYIRDNSFFKNYNLLKSQIHPEFRDREDIKKILKDVKRGWFTTEKEKNLLIKFFYKEIFFKTPYIEIEMDLVREEDNIKDLENRVSNFDLVMASQLSYLYWDNLDRYRFEENMGLKSNNISKILSNARGIDLLQNKKVDNIETIVEREELDEHRGEMRVKANRSLKTFIKIFFEKEIKYSYKKYDKKLYFLENEKKNDEKYSDLKYLYSATGTKIQEVFFGKNLDYKESGFFAVAFQKGENIIIAYRGTEGELLNPQRDIKTDVNIYLKNTDIQELEAVLFYEYIKENFGKVPDGKNREIFLTGHSMGGALAQYVAFYSGYFDELNKTRTWNGLGARGSLEPTEKFQLLLDGEKVYGDNDDICVKEKKRFSDNIYCIDGKKYGKTKKRLVEFYRKNEKEIEEILPQVEKNLDIENYFIGNDFVSGILNGDWIGEKIQIDKEEEEQNSIFISHNLNNFLNFLDEK